MFLFIHRLGCVYIYILSQQRPNFQTFWEPWGRLFERKPEKFKLLFPGDLVE